MSAHQHTHSLATSNVTTLIERIIARLIAVFGCFPDWLIAIVGRFSIAAVFWKSGQTKVQGFTIDLINGEFRLGWPHLSNSAIDLFKTEYRLPLVPAELAAPLAASAEHFFPILILFGLATRFSALALLGMTLVIEIFVYPDAYPTHGTWAAILLYLIAKGPGKMSIDHWIARHHQVS